MTKRTIIIIVGTIIVILVTIIYSLLISIIKEDRISLKDANLKIEKQQEANNSCSYTRDSLKTAVIELSKYKTLSQAMVRRDDVTKQLNHSIGDLVYMKNDSSKVVIEDVLIGGGKYNYYVKFKVLYKDQTTKEVIPELIY